MSKNYRLRTTPGIDKNIRIKVDQDFDFIEILSLKLFTDWSNIIAKKLLQENKESDIFDIVIDGLGL